MIDLHSHILPGLDDGASSLNQAIEMAKIAVESGIRCMAVTPHCVDDRRISIRDALALLRDSLAEAAVPLVLYPGMEIFGTESTATLLLAKKLLTINNSRYPLIEFSFTGSGEQETYILESVINAGYVPIVAHPERYKYVQENPILLNTWKSLGCLFQINQGSFLGHFGEHARFIAYEMTARGFSSVVASDAHSTQHRIPWLRDVRTILEREISPDAARVLLRQNPLRILKNEEIPATEPNWF
jgi:protein-tyrosine phosphatase